MDLFVGGEYESGEGDESGGGGEKAEATKKERNGGENGVMLVEQNSFESWTGSLPYAAAVFGALKR